MRPAKSCPSFVNLQARSYEELLGFGAINTHPDARISLAQQVESDGITFTLGLQGQLSLARVRIHDGVLLPCQVLTNWQLERSDFEPSPCPTDEGEADFADTHITALDVAETGAIFGATHRMTATATDDTGDLISYVLTADNGVAAPTIASTSGFSGAEVEIEMFLDTVSDWTFTLTVDDRPDCDDAAPDSTLVFGASLPENCTNGVDDDGDGDVDCDDEDCRDDEEACPRGGFVRGDSNSSGTIDLTDGVVTLNFLFIGGEAPMCLDAADTDGNNQLVISDAVIIFSYLFIGGPAPVRPSPSGTRYASEDCAPDPDDDPDLDCATPSPTCE